MSHQTVASSGPTEGWTRLVAATRQVTATVVLGGLIALTGCDSTDLMSPTSSDEGSFGSSSVTSSATEEGEEQLYLSDSGAIAPNGDGTILFLVELDDTSLEADLTELVTMPDPDFDQVDAIAATTDGAYVYAVDKVTSSLGVWDVVNETFTDEGVVADLPAGTVLAATAPDGTLWVANQANNNVYTIDTAASPPQATLVGTMSGTSFLGADLVFDENGSLFFWTNDDDTPDARGFYSLDQGSLAASYLGPEPTVTVDWFVTGLAIRDAGAGDIVGSTNEDEVRIIDGTNGSTVASYAMMLDDSPYEYEFGDMTVGELGPQEVGCTLTQGYWRTHNDTFRGLGGPPSDPTWEELPSAESTEFFGSGLSYYEVLWSSPRGNKAMILAHQYIAAELNLLNGASMPADVQDAFDDAFDFFDAEATGGEFPDVRGSDGEDLVALSEILTNYNEGLAGVPHCDTLEEEDE